jgi:hypothetical protein
VLALHDGKSDLAVPIDDFVWLIESAQPLTWSIGNRISLRER